MDPHHLSKDEFLRLVEKGRSPRAKTYLDPDHLFEKIAGVVSRRSPRYLTYHELIRIAAFLNSRLPAQVCGNEPSDVKQLTEEAFAQKDPGDAIRILMGLRGVGMGLASAVLAVLDPAEYPIITGPSARVILGQGRGERLTFEDYLRFKTGVERMAKRYGLTPLEVSFGLLALGRKS